MKIPLFDLTLGELEAFQEAGGTFDQLATGKLDAKALTALVLVAGRRGNPEFTVDDAKAVRFTEVELIAEDPQKAG